MKGVYAGLQKVSCDMCQRLVVPTHTVKHKDGSRVDICGECYDKCLTYPKFQTGVLFGKIVVRRR